MQLTGIADVKVDTSSFLTSCLLHSSFLECSYFLRIFFLYAVGPQDPYSSVKETMSIIQRIRNHFPWRETGSREPRRTTRVSRGRLLRIHRRRDTSELRPDYAIEISSVFPFVKITAILPEAITVPVDHTAVLTAAPPEWADLRALSLTQAGAPANPLYTDCAGCTSCTDCTDCCDGDGGDGDGDGGDGCGGCGS
jgi:hypothetical protein